MIGEAQLLILSALGLAEWPQADSNVCSAPVCCKNVISFYKIYDIKNSVD